MGDFVVFSRDFFVFPGWPKVLMVERRCSASSFRKSGTIRRRRRSPRLLCMILAAPAAGNLCVGQPASVT